MKHLITMLCALISYTTMSADALLPDLQVSQIANVGGLCIGDKNKIRVTITNSQKVGVKKNIKVKLVVKQGTKAKVYYKTLAGIGPSDNYGQPVVFGSVELEADGPVQFIAHVNYDLAIHESTYGNNTKNKTISAPRKNCGGGGQQTNAQTYPLRVFVFKKGTWNNMGSGQPVQNAKVVVKKGSYSVTIYTNAQGVAQFPAIPKGYGYNISVTKGSCPSASKPYSMPAYNAKVNMEFECN